MFRLLLVRGGFGAVLACMAMVFSWEQARAIGQELKPEGKPPAIAAAAPEPKAASKDTAPSKTRGRLPNYFGQVVDAKQADAIRQIQAKYAMKIAALKTQLDQLTKERDAKIAAVLTPKQQKKLDELLAAARDKRQKKANANNGPADTEPAPDAGR